MGHEERADGESAMSISLPGRPGLGKMKPSWPVDPRVSLFRRVLTADTWNDLVGILNATSVTPTDTVHRTAGDLRAEYRAHLEASGVIRHDHPGLSQIVQRLATVEDDAELHVCNLRSSAGRVVLVSDSSGQPIGAVVLRRPAASP